MSNEELEATIAKSCRILGRLDMTHAALGHVSYRAEGDMFMHIKGKGPLEVGLRYTSPEDVVKVNFEAEALEAKSGLQAPGESFLHLNLFAHRPEVRSVIHIHPEECLLMGMSRHKMRPSYVGYDPRSARLLADGVPIYPSAITIHDQAKGEKFAKFAGKSDVIIMRGHGITVCGTSIEDATVRAIALCRAVSIEYKRALLGRPRRLTRDDLSAFTTVREHRTRGSAGGNEGVLSIWNYYAELTNADVIHPNQLRQDERND
jgi:ribulose-5-phosphate 4-epimerase/fuculose-1-phosphate aldolase